MFNSKLRISIFDNLPKKLHLAKNLRFCANYAKKLRKTKISFHAQLSQKNISGFAQIAQKKNANLIAFHAQK